MTIDTSIKNIIDRQNRFDVIIRNVYEFKTFSFIGLDMTELSHFDFILCIKNLCRSNVVVIDKKNVFIKVFRYASKII